MEWSSLLGLGLVYAALYVAMRWVTWRSWKDRFYLPGDCPIMGETDDE